MSIEVIRVNNKLIERVEGILQSAYEEQTEFNAALNGASPIRFPSLRPGGDPYTLEASEALFWADREAYNDELIYWQGVHAVEIHQEAINQLRHSHQVPVLHNLADAMRRNRVAPFIGAGMSQPCSYPLWGAALNILISRIDSVDAAAVRARIAVFDYLGAAQMLWDADASQVKNFVRTEFAKEQIPPGGLLGPIKLLPQFSRGCIITTNFDPVIELVVGKGEFDGYMHGLQQGNKFVPKLIKGDRCILKLHGDAEDHETYVFTEKQYAEGYGSPLNFKKPLPRALRQIFISHSLLFLGCSLEQDRTLELFEKVCADKEFEIPDHFAILPEPLGAGAKSHKEACLFPLNIRPIWYPEGEHHFVESYLALAIDIAAGRISSF